MSPATLAVQEYGEVCKPYVAPKNEIQYTVGDPSLRIVSTGPETIDVHLNGKKIED